VTITSLNLEPPPRQPRIVKDERCPACKAPKERRINAGGFGHFSLVLCEACGHEFKDGD
jgi:ribosomal protein L37AE/L43A